MARSRALVPWLLLLAMALPAAGQDTVEETVEEISAAAVEVEEAASEEATREEIQRLFRVLKLRDGVLLEPREDIDGIAAIEVSAGGVVIDGDAVSDAELDDRLGAAAEPVRQLVQLERERRRGPTDDEVGAAEDPDDARPRQPRRPRRPRSPGDTQVVVGDSVVVEAGEERRDVVVFGGRLTIRGRVIGDAVAIGGSVLLERGGEVTGNLAAIGGPATLEGGAEVQGDVISVGNEVHLDDEAFVGGDLVEVPFVAPFSFTLSDGDWEWDWDDDWWQDRYSRGWGFGRIFGVFWTFIANVFWVLLACLAYLLARGPVERMERKVRVEPWKAALVGLLAAILFLPALFTLVLVLIISLIGCLLLPLVIFLLMAIVVVLFIAATAVALRIGRWTEEALGWKMVNPYVAIVVGFVLIHVWSFVADVLDLFPGALFPVVVVFASVGCLVQFVVLLLGAGAALLTRFGTRDDWDGDAPLPPIPGGGVPAAPAAPASAQADLDRVSGSGEAGADEPWEPRLDAPGGSEPGSEADSAEGAGPIEPGDDR